MPFVLLPREYDQERLFSLAVTQSLISSLRGKVSATARLITAG